MDNGSGESGRAAAPSPIRRAARMTGVFAGPCLLGMVFLGAFFGSLKPLDGAAEVFASAAPGSWRLCVSGGVYQRSEQTFLVVPHSFRERALFTAARSTADENSAVEMTRSSAGAFYAWISTAAIALLLTVLVSIPALWRLFRANPALATDPSLQSGDDAKL